MQRAAVFLVLAAFGAAKQFDKCGLVRALREQGFPEDQMKDWVCLVQNESSLKTEPVGPPNVDGSRDHGLFQINDRYWCTRDGPPGLECNVSCADLRTDDITAAAQCAKKIFAVQGFSAWAGWQQRCQGPQPDLLCP